MEKLAQFDRERIPERVVHARGMSAKGFFEVTHDVSHLTCADFLRAPGVQTPLIVRFSTVIHERGSPETLRDPRGFAVKFYTREGNFDMVGNNIPVFFIRDGIKVKSLLFSLETCSLQLPCRGLQCVGVYYIRRLCFSDVILHYCIVRRDRYSKCQDWDDKNQAHRVLPHYHCREFGVFVNQTRRLHPFDCFLLAVDTRGFNWSMKQFPSPLKSMNQHLLSRACCLFRFPP